MKFFVQKLVELYSYEISEFKEEFDKLENYECSTSFYDCIFIYLLVRYLKPINILEIGTFVGSTLFSIIKACEKNNINYNITTIDKDSHLKLDRSVLKHVKVCNGWSSNILRKIDKNCVYDFVFSDADLDSETSKILNNLINQNTFFATHDFVPPSDKGITSLANMIFNTKLSNNLVILPDHDCNWIYKSNNKESIHDNFSKFYLKLNNFSNIINESHYQNVNSCVAIISPKHIVNSLGLSDNKYLLGKDYIIQENVILNKDQYYINSINNKLYIKENDIILVSLFKNKLPYIIGFINQK